MCILFAELSSSPELSHYQFVLAMNRDEDVTRATTSAHLWRDDHTGVNCFSGVDNHRGGTWLGLSETGRLAALTNVYTRTPNKMATSRGSLVRNYITSKNCMDDCIEDMEISSSQYNPFNLLLFDLSDPLRSFCVSKDRNSDAAQFRKTQLSADVAHCISNSHYGCDYLKTTNARNVFATQLEEKIRHQPNENAAANALFRMMYCHDRHWPDPNSHKLDASDEQLHHTSSVFIDLPTYKTRTSTVILIDWSGRSHFFEKTWETNANSYHSFKF